MIFLIDYDRKASSLVEIRRFEDNKRAVADADRLDLEISYLREGLSREVVLLEAASEEDLRRTHRRYFEDLGQLASGPNSVFADAI